MAFIGCGRIVLLVAVPLRIFCFGATGVACLDFVATTVFELSFDLAKTSSCWPVAFFVVETVAVLLVEPVGFSLFSSCFVSVFCGFSTRLAITGRVVFAFTYNAMIDTKHIFTFYTICC